MASSSHEKLARQTSKPSPRALTLGGAEIQGVPCFLCGRKLEKRVTKTNRKPYFVCDACGIQLFVRGKQGIERLSEFFRNVEQAEIPFKQHAKNFYRLQAILKEIDDVRSEIKKTDVFWPSEDQKRTRKLLEIRIENLFSQIEDFAKTRS